MIYASFCFLAPLQFSNFFEESNGATAFTYIYLGNQKFSLGYYSGMKIATLTDRKCSERIISVTRGEKYLSAIKRISISHISLNKST